MRARNQAEFIAGVRALAEWREVKQCSYRRQTVESPETQVRRLATVATKTLHFAPFVVSPSPYPPFPLPPCQPS